MRTIFGKKFFDNPIEILDGARLALLLIDLQNDFCDPRGAVAQEGKDVSQIGAMFPRMTRLVHAGRRAGILTIWSQQTYLPNGAAESRAWLHLRSRRPVFRGEPRPAYDVLPYTLDGTWGQEIVDEFTPLPTEPIVKKYRSSAFFGTHLDLILRSAGIDAVVVAGVVTQGCVEATARDAQELEYYVILVDDCVATTDADVHNASLRCQDTRYDFVQSNQLISVWDGMSGA